MQNSSSIIITGRGGQGIITLGKLVSVALDLAGRDVAMYQEKGFSRRRGPVKVMINTGGYFTGDIPQGFADLLVILEPGDVEAYQDYLRPDGTLLVASKKEVDSVRKDIKVMYLDAMGMAVKLRRNITNVNMFMLAGISHLKLLGVDSKYIKTAIDSVFGRETLTTEIFLEGESIANDFCL